MTTTKYDLSTTNVPELLQLVFKEPQEVYKVLGQFASVNEPKDLFNNTALLVAAGQGNVETIKHLLDYGANIQDKNVFGKTVLHFASAKGHEAAVELLLERGANINAIDTSGNTVMHSAAEGGNINIAALFLDQKIDMKQKNLANETALQYAARGGNLRMVDFLLKRGADVKEKNPFGMTPLLHASEKGSEKVVRLLLENGADIRAKDVCNSNALHFAAESGNENLIKLFLNLKIDVNEKDFKDRTPLHFAVRNGHTEAVKLLLDNGAAIQPDDSEDQSALNRACEAGHESIVQLLLDRKSLITENVLHFAAKIGNIKILKQALELGIDVNLLDKSGRSALNYACESGNEKIVKVLLDHGSLLTDDILVLTAKIGGPKVFKHLIDFGADINKFDENGKSALHYASEAGNESVVRFLLGRGALIIEDQYKTTLLHFAAEGGNTNIIQLFLDRGIAVDARDKYGSTALHSAINRKNLSATKFLLDFGADVNAIRSYDDESALGIAIYHRFENGVKLLLERGANISLAAPRGTVLSRCSNDNIVKFLLLYGANPPKDDKLISGCFEWNIIVTVEKLFDEGVKLEPNLNFIKDSYYLKRKIDKSLQVFLDNGMNVNANCYNDCTIVVELISLGNYSAAKIVTRHVVKMKHQNLHVSDALWNAIMGNDILKAYQSECDKEIEMMKTVIIYNSTVSYFDVLMTRNSQQLVSFARNKDIIEGLKSTQKKNFPIYIDSLHTQIRNGTWRKLLMDQAADFFVAVTSAKCTDHQLPKLPATFVHDLFCCLSNKELKMLTRACKSNFEMDIHDVTNNLIFS